MPRSPSPERHHQPLRRRGGSSSQMLLHQHQHQHHPRRRSPSPPPRRSLRPRRAAAASSRPLVDDFFPFQSSPSSSPPRPPRQQQRPSPEPSSSDSGDGGGSSASDRRRRKLKLVVKLSQLPPEQQLHRRAPPPPPYSDDSDRAEEALDGASGDEEQVKLPKKRRIEQRGDRSRPRELVGGKNDPASGPRTKRLPVPGAARTTPLPDRKALEAILDKLQKKDTYGVFAEPVDPEELPDYHDVIEHPMDFGTVRRKLARNVYRSFEQFEDDVFLICSNAMQYNAPDTIYFRQAHSIQELARKKFQELRDEGIATEKQIKSEPKVIPNSCNRELVKKPVLRLSDDDMDFLTRKEQFKKPNVKSLDGDISFKDYVKKHAPRNLQDDNCLFHKERVKKPISRNSEDDLSSSLHKERARIQIPRNTEDDVSSSFGKEEAKKVISRNPENTKSSSLHKQVKKVNSQSSKNDFSSHKKDNMKPMCRNREDPDFSSRKELADNPVCTKEQDAGFLSPKRLAEKPISRNREDQGTCCHDSYKKPSLIDEQDDLGYLCNKEAVKKPTHMNGQDALGSDASAATIASTGDGSNGVSMSQANAAEPVSNECLDKDISSPLDEIRSEKTDDISAKPMNKSIVIDETRRKTYETYEEQPSLESDPIFGVFSAEPKELINVGLHAEHSYAYARSLARFAGSLGAQGWRIASEHIRKALPAEVKYGRGWVGEYEPPLPGILVVNDQSRCLKNSEANVRRNASLPRDNRRLRPTENSSPRESRRLRPTESNSPRDMSLSLLNRIMTTSDNVIGVPGPLECPEFKPRLFGGTTESQHRSTNASSPQENHKVPGNVAKTKRTASEKTRKVNSASSTRTPEMTGQSRPFFQSSESATHQMGKIDSSKSNTPIDMAAQRLECMKGASGVHNMASSNGLPKPFFQTQEAAAPQPKNEPTWVYHGRPTDGKVGTSNKSRPSTSVGFISKSQAANAANFAMDMNGQKNINDHMKSMGSSAIASQANIQNGGVDGPRNIFSAFPTAFRENQSIPSAPMVQSWISFGASSDNKQAIVSPTFLESNSGWKMPFANARPSDDTKLSALPQFFRQPVQVVRENPVQNKGLVIFPQLVQNDFSRSQGQPQWQELVPHMQQKPSKDVLRPDLNIGFPSPGSPPARQSSGINLEAQQPDLALQL